MEEKYQKELKMGICDTWPYSVTVFYIALQTNPAAASDLDRVIDDYTEAIRLDPGDVA